MTNKNFNNNGIEYVDLELPSGTLWAASNVGAEMPSDNGLYFQWGDTNGYTKDQVGTGDGKKKFSSDWSDYKFGVYPNFSKYTNDGETLELEDDAAHVHLGGDWHIPTPDQIQELIEHTTNKWVKCNGKNGRLFTSKKDKTKFIFIPAAGYALNGLVYGIWNDGSIWSSMLIAGSVSGGQCLHFYSDDAYLDGAAHYCGFSIRGVIG